MREYKINLIRDKEANVWVAASQDEDISGLILTSGSPNALIERIKMLFRNCFS